jgi:hypothetical protein
MYRASSRPSPSRMMVARAQAGTRSMLEPSGSVMTVLTSVPERIGGEPSGWLAMNSSQTPNLSFVPMCDVGFQSSGKQTEVSE